ncbi:hypothetical protein AB0D27_17870 [Streptomyces sp. NPDC048415]|uniref:hypothetical protein n=1 Tax=Streptomyces sp. NPDC048415 TaxID=3154822 RepID=UPI003448112D
MREAVSRLRPTATVSIRDLGSANRLMRGEFGGCVPDGSGQVTELGQLGDTDQGAAQPLPLGEDAHDEVVLLSRCAFQRVYSAGRQTAQGRYPATIAVASSGKNTRCST